MRRIPDIRPLSNRYNNLGYAKKSVWVAPLAGVTDKAFRRVVHELAGQMDPAGRAGPVHTITEMISCQALCHNNRQTLAMLDLEGEPEPRTVQIFGADPSLMAEAAKRVVSLGATAVNINMGCPVPKVVRNGEGAALLRDIPLAAEIARAVVAGVGAGVPVSVKTRLGWDEDHIVILELAPRLEQAGVAALMLHARTRSQFYGGSADWSRLARVRQAVGIPVIGNGDVRTPEDAARMLEQTGCDGVMIGRAMQGAPWLAVRTALYLAEEPGGCMAPAPPDPSPADKLRIIRRHCALMVCYKGEETAIREMRKHALWYTKGVRGAARLREGLARARSMEEFDRLMTGLFPEDE